MQALRQTPRIYAEVRNVPYMLPGTGFQGRDTGYYEGQLVGEIMQITDPIADMLTRIRNGNAAKHLVVDMPTSRMKEGIARVLKQEGYIADYEVRAGEHSIPTLSIRLYPTARNGRPVLQGLSRVSKPGLRIYTNRNDIPRVRSGLGLTILSTPKGIMSGRQAHRERLGGEVICYVW